MSIRILQETHHTQLNTWTNLQAPVRSSVITISVKSTFSQFPHHKLFNLKLFSSPESVILFFFFLNLSRIVLPCSRIATKRHTTDLTLSCTIWIRGLGIYPSEISWKWAIEKKICIVNLWGNNRTEIKMAYFFSVMNLDSFHCGCGSGFDCQLLNEPASRKVRVDHSEKQTDDVCFKERN